MSAGEPHLALRPATAEDRDFLASVYFGTRPEELAPVPWSRQQQAAFLAQQFEAQSAHYAREFRDASTEVILVDGEPAGRMIVMRYEHEILVVDIALLPQHRSHGVGTRLLRGLSDEAASRGAALTVHVEQTNRALALYRRLGFEEAGADGIYLRMRQSFKD